MVSILTEPAYSKSMWCSALLTSLTEKLRQKRISFCEIFDTVPEGCDGVFIIASDYNWIKSVISRLNEEGIKPILLCNQYENIAGCNYSCVCSDITGSMKYLLDELKSDGRTSVALYGVNTSSISDIGRVDGLLALKDESLNSMRIFVNDGSLKACFEEFFPVCSSFDAVICSNDFAAVSLIRYLQSAAPDILGGLKILSCAQTKLSDYYRSMITSVNLNFEQYGKAAVFIYEKLKSHSYMSGITITVNWNDIYTGKRKRTAVKLKSTQEHNDFYTDSEMREMLTVEHILSISSNTDITIANKLIDGATLEETAQQSFLTESGVKYRIKRILQECGIANRAELIRLLKRYLTT